MGGGDKKKQIHNGKTIHNEKIQIMQIIDANENHTDDSKQKEKYTCL